MHINRPIRNGATPKLQKSARWSSHTFQIISLWKLDIIRFPDYFDDVKIIKISCDVEKLTNVK